MTNALHRKFRMILLMALVVSQICLLSQGVLAAVITYAGIKPFRPAASSAIVGDIYIPSYNAGNVFQALRLASQRGLASSVYYVQVEGVPRMYFDMLKKYAFDRTPETGNLVFTRTAGNVADPTDLIWENVKYVADFSNEQPLRAYKSYTDDTSLVDISVISFKVRPAFVNLVSIETGPPMQVRVAHDVDLELLPSMLTSTNGTVQTYNVYNGEWLQIFAEGGTVGSYPIVVNNAPGNGSSVLGVASEGSVFTDGVWRIP